MDGLTIDNSDLYALWKASPGDSQIKLSQSEISCIRNASGGSTRFTPEVKARLSLEFKRILISRLTGYLKSGTLESADYADKEEPINPEQAFARLAQEQAGSPGVCSHPASLWTSSGSLSQPQSSGFFYWAKERFGELKPVINLIQVVIHREGTRTFLISKQVYSSHYTEAGLSVAEFIPLTDGPAGSRTLVVYTIRMELDMLGGTFGFLKKRMAGPRLLVTMRDSLSGLRINLENADSARQLRSAHAW